MVIGPDFLDHGVAGGVSGSSQVCCAEHLAASERHRAVVALVIEVGQQFELHRSPNTVRVSEFPAPYPLVVRLEAGVEQCLFQSCRLNRSAGDLQIDLDVDVGRARVPLGRVRA
jgi:hypothetical protein